MAAAASPAEADPLAESKLDALPGQNTTIAVVATDAALTRVEAKRLAIMAADGMARAIRPVHTPSTATRCSRCRPAGCLWAMFRRGLSQD